MIRPVYIYSLSDPRDDAIRYVGKTVKSLPKRRAQHVYSAITGGKCHRDKWIRVLLREGLKPDITLIEITSEEEWEVREIYWIAEYNKTHNLTNHELGGGMQSQPKGMKHPKVVYTTDEVRQACVLYTMGCSFQQIKTLPPFLDLKLKTLRGWAEKENRTDETLGIPMKSEYKREKRLALLE